MRVKEYKLNNEQRQLVENNMGLVYTTYNLLRPNFLVYNEKDDLISEGYIGLMYAAFHYRPETGYAFSTYAVHSIRSKMLRYLRKNSPCYGNIQGDDPIRSDSEDNNFSFFDGVKDETYIIEDIENLADINALLDTLSNKEKEMLTKFNEGYSLKEIADEYQKNARSVAATIRRARKKLRMRLEKEPEGVELRKAKIQGSGKYYIDAKGRYKPINRLTRWMGAVSPKGENNDNKRK